MAVEDVNNQEEIEVSREELETLEELVSITSQTANSATTNLSVQFEEFRKEQEIKEEKRWKLIRNFLIVIGSVVSLLLPLFYSTLNEVSKLNARLTAVETNAKDALYLKDLKELEKQDSLLAEKQRLHEILMTEKFKLCVTIDDFAKFKQGIVELILIRNKGSKK